MAGPTRTRVTNTVISEDAVNSINIDDNSIWRADINTTDSGKSLITKVIAGLNVNLSSTGADPGTGDVTINVTAIPIAVDYQKNSSLISQRTKLNFIDSDLIKFNLSDDVDNLRVNLSANLATNPVINGTLTVNSLMPAINGVTDIGSVTSRFGTIFVNEARLSTNTLYIGDTPILGTNAQTINVHADINQALHICTYGTGTTFIGSEKSMTVGTSTMDADVFISATGTNSNIRLNAAHEVQVSASSTIFNGAVTVNSQSIIGNLTIGGNLFVNGTQTSVNSNVVNIKDNIVIYNYGEVGNGVTAGKSGIQIDRGQDLPAYQLIFDETDDMFKVGALGSTLETIASHQWVNTSYSLKTHNHNLDLLSNVSISNKLSGDLIKWNGSQWINFTPTYISGNQTISISGDVVSTTGTTDLDLTLKNINANVGIFGSSSSIPVITTNAKGLITAITAVAITKADIGLGNVDNISDINKPISTATQTALDLKANQITTYTKTEVDAAIAAAIAAFADTLYV
jgi:hypothetical protein